MGPNLLDSSSQLIEESCRVLGTKSLIGRWFYFVNYLIKLNSREDTFWIEIHKDKDSSHGSISSWFFLTIDGGILSCPWNKIMDLAMVLFCILFNKIEFQGRFILNLNSQRQGLVTSVKIFLILLHNWLGNLVMSLKLTSEFEDGFIFLINY